MKLLKNVAANCRSLRIQRGLTQEELERRSGLSVRTIRRIENGNVSPHFETIRILAMSFDVTYEAMLSGHNSDSDGP